MKIAILGGGHGCYAAAADMSEQGHEVVLWRRDAAALAPLIASRSIVLKDAAGTRDVPIAGATPEIGAAVRDATLVLIPSFVLSELKTAFQMGFIIYIPFLIIDMVVASTLMSMGMLMLPPVTISLPFKVLLFVLIDGWHLIVRSLMTSFN